MIPSCRDELLGRSVRLVEPGGVASLEAHHGLADQVEAIGEHSSVNPGNPYRTGHTSEYATGV